MKLDYNLHLLLWQDFQNLTNDICSQILGLGHNQFTNGRDQGIDGLFIGTATKFPSTTSPWKGKFICQAKHTTNLNASFSDSSFLKEIDKELRKLKKIKFDYYLLFANRKLTSERHSELKYKINSELDTKDCFLFGLDKINELLYDYESIRQKYGLDSFAGPLIFYEKDICEVILFFYKNIKDIPKYDLNKKITLKYTSKEEKNRKNDLSQSYFNKVIIKDLPYFNQIKVFLEDPKNNDHLEAYINTTTEINNKINVKRNEFDKFEQIIDYIYNFILARSSKDLKSKRKLIYTFLHFMYYNCDIGDN